MVVEDRTSWNSGGAAWSRWDSGVPRSAWVVPGEVTPTRSSRHSVFSLAAAAALVVGLASLAPSGVVVTAADWKVWMGRASKNSCATIKGILSGSVLLSATWHADVCIHIYTYVCVCVCVCVCMDILPVGIGFIESAQTMGVLPYLDMLCVPDSVCVVAASVPQRRFLCAV